MSKLKSLLQQAELYRKQGLLNESHNKYQLAKALVEKAGNVPNREQLLGVIMKKIDALNKDFEAVRSAPQTPEMSAHVNELIKNLFSFSKDENDQDMAALEGAIALAKFGQFESALVEFTKLLKIESLRVAAAKNILRCHMTLSSAEQAVDQYRKWETDDLFKADQVEKVRRFLEELLDKKGISKESLGLSKSAAAPAEDSGMQEDEESQFLDISAVAIALASGPHKGEQVELDVSFQQGNIISLIIGSRDEELIENLQVGARLDDVHFYSPIAIFRGAGVVTSMTKITSGPKEGDYSLDIKIESF